MTEDAASRWPAPLPVGNADTTLAAAWVSPGRRIFEVMVACGKCGVRQTFWGTVPEIGDAAEVWQRGHQCAVHTGESWSAALDEREPVRLPGIN
jgi:hypothetical protein